MKQQATKAVGRAAAALAVIVALATGAPLQASDSIQLSVFGLSGSVVYVAVTNPTLLVEEGTVQVVATIEGATVTAATSVVANPLSTTVVTVKFSGGTPTNIQCGFISDTGNPF